ncbi:hypothetical protein EKO04_006314 [Ascochyta lentis]|uniref:Uncharacterized protein n=1 Tax=Ascochyta lentis TaxID=205686 RepID=A0A8H7MJA9_9PLEO|nr:hypothetical protein EKO04_006314 [Ascochyta lentis]
MAQLTDDGLAEINIALQKEQERKRGQLASKSNLPVPPATLAATEAASTIAAEKTDRASDTTSSNDFPQGASPSVRERAESIGNHSRNADRHVRTSKSVEASSHDADYVDVSGPEAMATGV